MQEDIIKVFCLAHSVSFTMPRSNQAVVCKDALADHVLSNDFPNSGKWFYCCQCQIYWVTDKGHGGFLRQCPSCGLIKNPRYYSCDQCNVTMMDSWGATNQRDISITPWGAPHPYCPGCYQLPKSVSQSHTCPELNGLLTTARAECPFCEAEEKVEFDTGIAESEEICLQSDSESAVSKEICLQSDSKSEAPQEICLQSDSNSAVSYVTLPSGVERHHGIETGASDLFLEEIERKTAEVRALKAEAEAREAKAQERLRQAEIRLQQEISIRSEAEQKSKDIEEELRQRLEIEQAGLEVVSITSETIAEIEAERNARLAAEQAKAEAEARFRDMEARACEAEERRRQAETGLQQEVAKRALAEERANRIEIEFNRSLELTQAEFEAGIAKLKAEAQSGEESIISRLAQQAREELEAVTKDTHARIETEVNLRQEAEQAKAEAYRAEAEAKQTVENYKVEITKVKAEVEARVQEVEAKARQAEENYKVEIAEIRAELGATAIAVNQAEESHRAEIAKVSAEAEAQAHQAEANARQQYQTKIEEAITSAQAAMFTLEETQKKLVEAEAKYREMEAKARRAETRSRQVYLISRLSFALIEQISGDLPKMSDEKGGLVIPPDFATNAYLDKFFSDVGESDTNGSMDYFSLPDKLKAMFEVLAGAQVFDDEGNSNGNGMSLGPVERATNHDAIPASVILASTESVIS